MICPLVLQNVFYLHKITYNIKLVQFQWTAGMFNLQHEKETCLCLEMHI